MIRLRCDHDGPAQSLSNFILQAEICQRLFDRDPDMANKELGNLKSAASVSFQKIRDFIFELRPMTFFIFPAIWIVLLGPSVMVVMDTGII